MVMERRGIILTGGTVLDPSRGMDGVMNVGILGDTIRDVRDVLSPASTIDCSGCVVLPGLIDFHCHFYDRGSEIAVPPDMAFPSQGVTTVVDMGSAGSGNFESFYQSVMVSAHVRTFAYLNVCRTGLVTTKYMENINPDYFDRPGIAELLKKYQGRLLGLKIRQSREISGDLGIEPLKETVKMAEALGCPVVVHTTNPPCDIGELADVLRKGDIFSHVFHGKGSGIIQNGGIHPKIIGARERGVLFDTADGRAHSCLSVIRKALDASFFPDVLSTDQTRGNLYDPSVFGLPMVLSKYLAAGYPLEKLVPLCTTIPARIIGMQGRLGTLAPGALADISVFKIKDIRRKYNDHTGEELIMEKLLIPMLTVLNGVIVYRNMEI